MCTVTLVLLMFMGVYVCCGEVLDHILVLGRRGEPNEVSFTQAKEFRSLSWRHAKVSERFIRLITTGENMGEEEKALLLHGFRKSAEWYVCFLAYAHNGERRVDETSRFSVLEVRLLKTPEEGGDPRVKIVMKQTDVPTTYYPKQYGDIHVQLRFKNRMFGAIFFREAQLFPFRRTPTGCSYHLYNHADGSTAWQMETNSLNKMPSIREEDVNTLPTELPIPPSYMASQAADATNHSPPAYAELAVENHNPRAEDIQPERGENSLPAYNAQYHPTPLFADDPPAYSIPTN